MQETQTIGGEAFSYQALNNWKSVVHYCKKVDCSFRLEKLLTWNKHIFRLIGLWPTEQNDHILLVFLIYLFCHCCLQYADLLTHINDLEHVVANLTESAIMTMIFCKTISYRVNSKKFSKLLNTIEEDYAEQKFIMSDEKLGFIKYHAVSCKFVKGSVSVVFISSVLYYLKPLCQFTSINNHLRGENVSETYVLPYRVKLFFEIPNQFVYILIYLYQMPVILTATIGTAGMDCLLVTFTFHICGQFSSLAYTVRKFGNYFNQKEYFKKFVDHHVRLVRMSKDLDAAFNLILLQQLLGLTLLLCLTGYNIMANSAIGNYANFVTFIMYTFSLLLMLFFYCYTGECLITESWELYDALCNCNWYEFPSKYAKQFILCLSQTRNSLHLTAGTYYVLSINGFGDVIKNSAAYLSVLRKFI